MDDPPIHVLRRASRAAPAGSFAFGPAPVAAGYVVHTFHTGRCTVIGNPAVPALEISGNPLEIRTMDAHMDVGVPGVLSRETTISEAGDAIVDMVVRTANGRLASAESLGHREFVTTELFRSG